MLEVGFFLLDVIVAEASPVGCFCLLLFGGLVESAILLRSLREIPAF